jgi:hypothetical protein
MGDAGTQFDLWRFSGLQRLDESWTEGVVIPRLKQPLATGISK